MRREAIYEFGSHTPVAYVEIPEYDFEFRIPDEIDDIMLGSNKHLMEALKAEMDVVRHKLADS